jgi:hypothetical protein
MRHELYFFAACTNGGKAGKLGGSPGRNAGDPGACVESAPSRVENELPLVNDPPRCTFH